jgi:IS5 family transposase
MTDYFFRNGQDQMIDDLVLFGAVSAVAGGGVFNALRPRLPTRLMVALLYLKHVFNENDEDVIQRWALG